MLHSLFHIGKTIQFYLSLKVVDTRLQAAPLLILTYLTLTSHDPFIAFLVNQLRLIFNESVISISKHGYKTALQVNIMNQYTGHKKNMKTR